ncbi:unnamed protein product [Moneuplotes crassus]|uniref:Uncharacterized protein n=1 Tax=Euplotes crassus TaxID=5936 RepID=A0AAD1YAD0_EUPCR|nr:unnamed protein product [Moneuplotes crassus]
MRRDGCDEDRRGIGRIIRGLVGVLVGMLMLPTIIATCETDKAQPEIAVYEDEFTTAAGPYTISKVSYAANMSALFTFQSLTANTFTVNKFYSLNHTLKWSKSYSINSTASQYGITWDEANLYAIEDNTLNDEVSIILMEPEEGNITGVYQLSGISEISKSDSSPPFIYFDARNGTDGNRILCKFTLYLKKFRCTSLSMLTGPLLAINSIYLNEVFIVSQTTSYLYMMKLTLWTPNAVVDWAKRKSIASTNVLTVSSAYSEKHKVIYTFVYSSIEKKGIFRAISVITGEVNTTNTYKTKIAVDPPNFMVVGNEMVHLIHQNHTEECGFYEWVCERTGCCIGASCAVNKNTTCQGNCSGTGIFGNQISRTCIQTCTFPCKYNVTNYNYTINTFDITQNNFRNITVLPRNQSFGSMVYETKEDRFVLAGILNLMDGVTQNISTRLYKINPNSLACDYFFDSFGVVGMDQIQSQLQNDADYFNKTVSYNFHDSTKMPDYPPITHTYNFKTKNESEIYCKTKNFTALDLFELTNKSIGANVTCSNSTPNKVESVSVALEDGSAKPSWVTFSSSTREMNISAPETNDSDKFELLFKTKLKGKTEEINQYFTITINDTPPEPEPEPKPTPEPMPPLIELSEQASFWAKVMVFLASAINIANAMLGSASPAAIWQMMNQIQLLKLLLLTGAYLPSEAKEFFNGMEFMSFDFSFIPFGKLPGLGYSIDFIDFDQNSQELNDFGLESGSSLVNNLSFILFLIFIAIIHFILILVIAMSADEGSCCVKLFNCITTKLRAIFTYTIYIRALLEAFVLLVVSLFAEFYSTSSQMPIFKLISLVFAIGMMISLSVLVILFIRHLRNTDPEERDEGPYKELYCGVKESKLAMTFNLFFLLRRLLFVFVLVLLQALPLVVKLSLIMVLEICYIGFVIVYIRPFEKIDLNVVELANEIFFSFFLCSLFSFNQEQNWTTSFITIYIYALTANNFIVVAISLGFKSVAMTKGIIKLVQKYKSKPKITPTTTNQIDMDTFARNRPHSISNCKLPTSKLGSSPYSANMKSYQNSSIGASDVRLGPNF